MARLLLILTLALQPALLQAGGRLLLPALCESISCCEVVETTVCCDEVVIETACGESKEVCVCGIEPGRPESPAPASLVRSSFEVLLTLAPRPTGVELDWQPAASDRWRVGPIERTVRSHNTQQALLGVWQT